MTPRLRWKIIFILGVILFCIFGLVGLPEFPTSLATLKSNFAQRIRLGLDLRGGTHMVLQVQVQEAIGLHCDQTVDQLSQQLHQKNIGFGEISRVDDTHILIRNVAPDQVGNFRNLILDSFGDWNSAPAAGEASGYLLTMKPSVVTELSRQTMVSALEIIRRRIDQLGLTEPTIAPTGRGENEILVQLPGEGDPTRAKSVIQAGGQLELTLVEDDRTYASEAEAQAAHGGVLPAGTELVPGRPEIPGPTGQSSGEVWYVLDRLPAITGQDLRSANPAPNTSMPGRYEVRFTVATTVAPRFGAFTEQNIHRKMAIVLDHHVQSAPVINGRIEDSGVIEGSFTQEEAQDLALVLRAGSLPASIKYLEESTIGPSLGADSIREGVRASVVSLRGGNDVPRWSITGSRASTPWSRCCLTWSSCWPRSPTFEPCSRLPGIAGVILTIGMGVDSNVLVFERIREELRDGKPNSSAVERPASIAPFSPLSTPT